MESELVSATVFHLIVLPLHVLTCHTPGDGDLQILPCPGTILPQSQDISFKVNACHHLCMKQLDLAFYHLCTVRLCSELQELYFRFPRRNVTVIADYHLEFLVPEEQQDQLRKFILSRKMVYNVFRQSLYDQDPPTSGSLYIDPLSLNMV